jgi:hypothetical protein
VLDASDSSRIWEQVKREFSCDHPEQALTFKDARNGARLFRHQCVRCGHGADRLRSATLSTAEKVAAVPFDEGKERDWWEARTKRIQELTAAAEAQRKREWDRWYARQLQTPRWYALRTAVIRRDGGICRGCLKRQATQVHHLTYERVGREMAFDLVSICDACHEAIGGKGD